MNGYYKKDEWLITEEGFHPEMNRESESIFSIGNGYMGQRANFEEQYSGDSLRGSYVAGVYYPDKTRVGWWKNGYPEYFAKVLNAPSWIGIDVTLNDEPVDLAKTAILSFVRTLNMKEGYLERRFRIATSSGAIVDIAARRFVSMASPETGLVRYIVRSADFTGELGLNFYIDADVRNEDTNYGEKFWEEVSHEVSEGYGNVIARTLKTGFQVATSMSYELRKNGEKFIVSPEIKQKTDYVANLVRIKIKPGDEIIADKYVAVLSTLNIAEDKLEGESKNKIGESLARGYDNLFNDHIAEWERIWSSSDVVIEGDVAAQQAIRFNIFQLNQTYTGKDERLNIGPKGFTGEKYGGSTYWDTEAYALPFFLKTADPEVGRNLLVYRYKQLGKAIENGSKLGFTNGAALFPMVTMNGEECHNEWEITFEEIHRNGAIAFAVFNYIRHTGDTDYMADFGLELLIAIARFWSQRTNWSENLGKYVILGVTGPNEYENNVHNNWYTNYIAVWTLKYTLENVLTLKESNKAKAEALFSRISLDIRETERWADIAAKMHFPFDPVRNIYLQQDGFLDKEIIPAEKLDPSQRPLNQHWSWDRILRSCYIKQADVLQGLYFFEDNFDVETLRRNFDFYEPITVHESSLSACIHAILAARIGNIDRAYDLYLRTARLDLDDYNKEVCDGLHITSMAGTWLAIVEGFGGMRIEDGRVILKPLIPEKWDSYSFHARYLGHLFMVSVTGNSVKVKNLSAQAISMIVSGKDFVLDPYSSAYID